MPFTLDMAIICHQHTAAVLLYRVQILLFLWKIYLRAQSFLMIKCGFIDLMATTKVISDLCSLPLKHSQHFLAWETIKKHFVNFCNLQITLTVNLLSKQTQEKKRQSSELCFFFILWSSNCTSCQCVLKFPGNVPSRRGGLCLNFRNQNDLFVQGQVSESPDT